MDYVTSGYVVAGFLILFGVSLFWIAGQLPADKKLLNWQNIIRVLAGGYILLSFLYVFVATGSSLFLSNHSPCESVVNSTIVSGNTTAYTYVDGPGCGSVPSTNERMYTILGWVLFVTFALIAVGVIALFVRMVMRW